MLGGWERPIGPTGPLSVPWQLTTLQHTFFHGLDTFAKVRLNGAVILESDNIFLSHRVYITDRLNKPE